MARRTRRKQPGIIGTLIVELSALAGIFGVAQPSVRDSLWQLIQPATINSSASQATPQEFREFVPQPESYGPTAARNEVYQPTYPPSYMAQAVKPQERNPSVWNASGYNPMGTYQ